MFSFIRFQILSPFLVSPIPSTFPLLTNPPTPTSPSWNSPTLGHWAFTRPRASPLIDVPQVYPLLHMQLEPWIPSCALFGWFGLVWFGLVGLVPGVLGLLVSSYCCSSYGAATPFSSLGPFSSSSTGDPALSPMDGCVHSHLHLSGTGRASQETTISGSCLEIQPIYSYQTQTLLWMPTSACWEKHEFLYTGYRNAMHITIWKIVL